MPASPSPASAHPAFAERLAAARAGSREALDQVFRNIRRILQQQKKQMRRAIQSKYGDSDLSQDVLVEAYAHFAEFQGETERELCAWVLAIAHDVRANVERQYLHRAKRNVANEVSLDTDEIDAQASPPGREQDASPLDAALRRDESEAVRRVMEQLPPHMRRLLEWRCTSEMSFDAIGQRLRCNADTARRLMRGAMRRFTEIRARTISA